MCNGGKNQYDGVSVLRFSTLSSKSSPGNPDRLLVYKDQRDYLDRNSEEEYAHQPNPAICSDSLESRNTFHDKFDVRAFQERMGPMGRMRFPDVTEDFQAFARLEG